ncbi:NUDIX hydrolase [Spirochaeta thermophila DSM 6578]|uniref:NUDIX hydrolase n=1 Tax=Winmispira thermophila (strain ATCC 700085 / DSM 6578 / Z-1203) TaxID=869211 RepID=G0GC79_WINT7|nr:CoA pyrophosphatase [Spirochaeta thermophila]AEJ60443.1 NUDIX hydrolase [Spirochaeta thermophila DSM 6578]
MEDFPLPGTPCTPDAPPSPLILNAPDFTQAAVLVPCIPTPTGWHIGFEVRAHGIPQEGEICFPGGLVEPHDPSPLHTALRETGEELGIPGSRIPHIRYAGAFLSASGRLIHVFPALVPSWHEAHPSPDEVSHLFTLPLSWLHTTPPRIHHVRLTLHPREGGTELLPASALGLPSHYHTPWKGPLRPIYLWHTPHGPLWGITAGILYHLLHPSRG